MATGTPSTQTLATPIRFRRNASRLTTGQRKTLRDAFKAVKGISDDRGYDYHAGIHGLPLPIGCDNAHNTPYFLPWHRAYLYFFERALRDQVPSAMVVWWDWRTGPNRPPRMPRVYTEEKVGGQPNPLLQSDIPQLALDQGGPNVPSPTFRAPGRPQAPPLPTVGEVEDALQLSQFGDFSQEIERLHGNVHAWVGGHMGVIPYASYDPIFWAHHCMIDRLWRLWQLRHPGANPPAAILDDPLPPFRMTVRRTLSVTALGYDYAGSSSSNQPTP